MQARVGGSDLALMSQASQVRFRICRDIYTLNADDAALIGTFIAALDGTPPPPVLRQTPTGEDRQAFAECAVSRATECHSGRVRVVTEHQATGGLIVSACGERYVVVWDADARDFVVTDIEVP